MSAWIGAFDIDLRYPRYPAQSYPASVILSRFLDTPPKQMLHLARRFLEKRLGRGRTEPAAPSREPAETAFSFRQIRTYVSSHPDDVSSKLTLSYLDASLELYHDNFPQAAEAFRTLSTGDPALTFPHYSISIAALAALRAGQCLDLAGDRPSALGLYAKVVGLNAIPEVTAAAEKFQKNPFHRTSTSGQLLREFNLALEGRKIWGDGGEISMRRAPL